MLLDFVVELGDVSLELLGIDDPINVAEVVLVEDDGVDELVDVVEVWSPMS